MNKFKSEKGGITVFVIVAFLFIMAILIGIYWKSTNYQVTVLQAEQQIKDTYGRDVNNVDEIYNEINEGMNYTITFNANGGSIDISNKQVSRGSTIGNFPLCLRENYGLLGWFTDVSGGNEVTSSTIITSDMELFAHWTTSKTKIGNKEYDTINDAIKDVPTDNTETTIKLLADSNIEFSIGKGQNVILDAKNYTLRSTGATQVVNNFGTLHINSGTIEMNGGNAAIDNKSGGKLIVTGGTIISNGGKAAIFNEGGIVEISGNPRLISNATGNYGGVPRATVQNLVNGRITITGGTFICTTAVAVSNNGTITIGTNDETVDTDSIVMQGATYGIVNNSGKTFNFYDGIAKGKTGAIKGTLTPPTGYHIDDTQTEIIDDNTYKTGYVVHD